MWIRWAASRLRRWRETDCVGAVAWLSFQSACQSGVNAAFLLLRPRHCLPSLTLYSPPSPPPPFRTAMLSLTRTFGSLRPFGGSSVASSSRSLLPTPTATTPTSLLNHPPLSNQMQQVRFKGNLAPRRTKYRKSHKGRVPLPSGGSTKGTTLAHGSYGLRLLAPARLSAKQLESAEVALKRHLKVLKGAQVFMRVFPDVPVCVKGNETRMGKGK